jgi:ferredoxin
LLQKNDNRLEALISELIHMAKVTFLPSNESIDIDSDTTLREAAHLLDVNVHDRCGGLGACCNCVVTVVEGAENILPKTVIEEAVFYLAADDRLSCQCRITGDVVVKTI